MFDTLAVMAYLLGNDAGHLDRLHLQIPAKQSQACLSLAKSPALQWQGVPPEASSLALLIKDNKKYAWVVYNLPVDITGLPTGANTKITAYDEGMNSWGQKNYHSICTESTKNMVEIKLIALDTRFNTSHSMTGEQLEEKIKNHALAETHIKLQHYYFCG